MAFSSTALTNNQKLWGLIRWILLCFLTAGLGAWLTSFGVNDWYVTIQKPVFNPPKIVFPIVWNTLYILLAFSGWQVWLQASGQWRSKAVILMLVQLGLNIVWSTLFFTWHWIDVAFFELTLMVLLAWWTWRYYWKTKPLAAWLMLPYVCWISFALILNASIWGLNQ